jgi:hypothetical protein
MRFIDTNVFVYAVLKPTRELNEQEQRLKRASKAIFKRVNEGEEVVTTVVHLSELANVMEDAANLTFSISFVKDILLKRSVHVEQVSDTDYIESVVLAEEKRISINDALAYLIMNREMVEEIYTFDKHFDILDIKVVRL